MDHSPKLLQTETGGNKVSYFHADERLSDHLLSGCRLCLLKHTSNRFRFAIFEQNSNDLLAVGLTEVCEGFNDFKTWFEKTLASDSLYKFSDYFLITESKSLLIPTSLYSKEDERGYLTLNFGEVHDSSCFQPFEDHLKVVFEIDKITEDFEREIPAMKILPHWGVILEYLNNRSFDNSGNGVYLFQFEDKATICIYEERKLKFCNDFKASEPADVIYYLLSVLEEMGLDGNRSNIYTVNTSVELDKLLASYLSKVEKKNIQGDFNTSGISKEISLTEFQLHFFKQVCG